jgi:hypothetical protein
MSADQLIAEAKSLDALISNLEVEAFRHASSGLQQRGMEASRRAKELRLRRNDVLRALQSKNKAGSFGDLGAAKRSADDLRQLIANANHKRVNAEHRIEESQKTLLAIAGKAANKAIAAGKGIGPDDIKSAYYEMAKAGRDYVEACGAIEVIKNNNSLRRSHGEREAVQRLIAQHGKFAQKIPSKMAARQWQAFNLGASSYRTILNRMSRTAPVSDQSADVLRKVIARPKRKVSPNQLRAIKKQIALAPNARIPDPSILRILAHRIATRYPRPHDMREELYADFILEMTKRAAIYTANEQAKGSDTTTAITVATETAVTQDLPAVKEEVITGVTAPAGEQVVAAAVQAAAPQVIQGAADAGTMPSVPAAPASEQAQAVQIASAPNPTAAAAAAATASGAPSADSAAADVSDAQLQAAFDTSASDGTAQPAAPAAEADTSDSLATTSSDADVPAAIPFYKRHVVLVVGAVALAGGYMVWRDRAKSEAAPTPPTPGAE